VTLLQEDIKVESRNKACDRCAKLRLAISYGESQTSRRHDAMIGSGPGGPYDDNYRPPRSQPSYSTASSQRGYPATVNYPPPVQGGGYSDSIYPPGSGFPQGSAYPAESGFPSQAFPTILRPRTNDSDYTYGRDDYQGSVDPYRQPNAYMPGTREPVRVEREPRYIERDPRTIRDPRDTRDTRDGRDPRDVRDPRMDPPRERRIDSRALPPGYAYVGSPGDDRMMDVDDERFGYIDTVPPIPNGRGYPPNSRIPASGGYDPRTSPGLREYRAEPMREERRRR